MSAVVDGGADHVDRIEKRTMYGVVRTKLERSQQLWQHASIVRTVGGAHDGVDACISPTTAGGRFLHQLLECGLPGDRENNLAHNAVGLFQRGAGDVE